MAPKTTCLFFGIIFIALQFCYVFCNDVSIDFKIDSSYYGDPKDIHFSCEVYMYQKQAYTCKFQLTDGTFIEYKPETYGTMKEYVNNATYKYTISHEIIDHYAKCAIIIHKPYDQLVLRDTFKCWIITKSATYSEIYSDKRVLEMKKTASSPTGSTERPTAAPIALRPIISSNKVHVRRGDNFKIGCQVMQPIDYCFLQSPDGTMFAVAYGDIAPNDPSIITNSNPCNVIGAYRTMADNFACEKYLESQKNNNHPLENSIETLTPTIDSDFSVGDCFAVIKNANNSHNGNWRCQLDLHNPKKEIQTIVPVTVEESYLLTSVETVPQTTKTIIKCSAIPTLPSKMMSCRWTFPNGTGIYEENISNIEVSHTDTSCVLKLNDWNNDYKGKWSCFAAFENDFGDKFHTSKFISIWLDQDGTPRSSSTTAKSGVSSSSPTWIHIWLLSILIIWHQEAR